MSSEVQQRFQHRVHSVPGKGANFQKSREYLKKSGSFLKNLHRPGKSQGKYFIIVKNV